MHLRYQRAAVATEEAGLAANPRPSDLLTPSKSAQILWATPALSVPAGRLVGVRLLGKTIEVALVKPGAERAQWVVADTLLNDSQVTKWLRTSRFASK